MEDYPYAVTVVGEWASNPPKAIKNKLQIYFHSKKKSGGGDCQVEFTGRAATVSFKSKDVRERVLVKEDHELAEESGKVKLRLLRYEENLEEAVHGAEVEDIKPAESGVQEEIQSNSAELSQARAVLVENVLEKLSREVLGMMVESICNVTEEEFSLEMIRDMNTAVVTFSQPSAAERFLSKCSGHSRFQQYQLQGRVLEPTCSVRVENLPPLAEEELLELYFEKERQGGGRVAGITMIPEEQAAIITFQDPKVAENVLQRKHHICKALVSVYPYQQALGTALYGTDRPEWKLPEAFTENLHPALGKFLLQESQLAAISPQMQAQFCQVEFSTEHAKLRPLPGLLKQKGLTANRIEGWRGEASQAFRSIVARYRCFECPVSASVWKAAEREIRQAVSEDAVLLPNLPNGVVAIAGLAKDVDRIQKEVEEMVQRAANQLERERDGVSEEMVMSPGMHSILQQAGLQSVFTQTYPALSITYRSDTQRLVLSGLPTEVIMVKNWVLEKKLEMKQRPLDLEPDLLGFLSTANSEEISQKLFTSCGVSAVYKMWNKGLVLVGASEEALSKAERLLKEALAFQSVEVEDEAVLHKQEWAKLKRQLMEANNSSGQSTVSIQLRHQGCVTVTGFRKAVQDVADSLSRFLNQHSCVEEAVPVRTTAILNFLQEHKATDWRQQADAEEVSVRFQDKKPQVVLGGARFRVQGLKRLFAQLDAALYTDRLKIIKPGARKYFMEKKQIISMMMKDKKCVVVLQEEGEQEEEEPMTQAVKTVVADVRRPMLSQSSPEAEQRREETAPQAEEWNSSSERQRSSADQSWDKPSQRRGELETLHTERRQEKNTQQAAGWSSPSERQWSSADQSRDKPSASMAELEALHTKEGLLIVLRKGNIEDASTDVIVNTISVDLDLRKGAVSKAILQAAGPQLQGAVRDQARRGEAEYGDVMHTNGFQLRSDIFHTICPFWNDGAGQAEQTLINTVKTCLRDAEKQKARSLAFPAIGTGNLGFPKPLVAKTMLSEVQGFSHKRAPTHLRKVVFMVHPSDTQTVECFVREFRGQAQRQGGPSRKHYGQSQQDRFHASQSEQAFFGQVSNPTLGVHSMGIGHLTLEVSSGDITRETTHIIVNSSNQDFSLKAGVSKAILEAAGPQVEEECAQLASQQHSGLIVTQAGNLRCRSIIHTMVRNDAANIKDVVFQVLQVCEENRAASVAFPALGTGQGGVSPPLVAEAMISAVTDFVMKKPGQYLKFVKIVIFQPEMVSHFHKNMKKREGGGQPVGKGFLAKMGETRKEEEFVLEGEEFSPTVFQFCGESVQAVAAAKEELRSLLVKEQLERIVTEPTIALLGPRQRLALQDLQKRLTVRIQLESHGGPSSLRLEGLSRDVLTAESEICQMIREVELAENQRREAALLSDLVEWQYEDGGIFVPFDSLTNLKLENAFHKNSFLKININNSEYKTDLARNKAFGQGREVVLKRTDLKEALPGTWDSMGGSALRTVALRQGSKEYQDVEAEFRRSGLTNSIVEIVRIQNEALWKQYQIKKESLDTKYGHKNNEQRLFHGTHAPFIKAINLHGFNRSYAGAHAAVYGKGTYFAVDPKYSTHDTYSKADAQGHKHMYLALVLVGEFTIGDVRMVVPPERDPGKSADLYDSVVDNTANPTMYIIFNDVQAYPEYLIKFK